MEIPYRNVIAIGMLISPLIVIAIYLYINPLSIPCLTCSTDTWFYKCLPDTGIGSVTCSIYEKIDKILADLKESIVVLIKTIITIYESIKTAISDFVSAINKFTQDVPNVFKSIDFSNIDVRFKSNTGSLSFNMYVPLINVNLGNIVKPINDGLQSAINAIASSLKYVLHDVIEPMLHGIGDGFSAIFKGIGYAIQQIISVFAMPYAEIKKLIGPAGELMKKAFNEMVIIAEDILTYMAYGLAKFLNYGFPQVSIWTFFLISMYFIFVILIGGTIGGAYFMYRVWYTFSFIPIPP